MGIFASAFPAGATKVGAEFSIPKVCRSAANWSTRPALFARSNQRHILFAAKARKLRSLGHGHARPFRVRGKRPAVHHAHEEIERCRGSTGQFLRFRNFPTWAQAGSHSLAVATTLSFRCRPTQKNFLYARA